MENDCKVAEVEAGGNNDRYERLFGPRKNQLAERLRIRQELGFRLGPVDKPSKIQAEFRMTSRFLNALPDPMSWPILAIDGAQQILAHWRSCNASSKAIEPTGILAFSYSRIPPKTRLPVLCELKEVYEIAAAKRGHQRALLEYRYALITNLIPLLCSQLVIRYVYRKEKPE
jgi:hypothetical protein